MAKTPKPRKTAKKMSADEALAPPSGRNGNRLPIGKGSHKGGKKGRSGRPRKVWKNFMADLRSNPEVQFEFEDVAKDRNHKHWPTAMKVLTDYDDEMPAHLTPEEAAARVAQLLKVAEARKAAAAQGTPAGDGPT